MWLGIIFIIGAIISLIIVSISKRATIKNSFSYALFYFAVIGGLLLGIWSEEKNTAIKCHKGNNPYIQVIQYEYDGNKLISQDTIYIKK